MNCYLPLVIELHIPGGTVLLASTTLQSTATLTGVCGMNLAFVSVISSQLPGSFALNYGFRTIRRFVLFSFFPDMPFLGRKRGGRGIFWFLGGRSAMGAFLCSRVYNTSVRSFIVCKNKRQSSPVTRPL